MPREKMQEIVLKRMLKAQGDKKSPVWMSGRQITELLPGHNPSSIRMALLLLYESGAILRERRKGRGKKGKTGSSAWYAVNLDYRVDST